MCLVLELGISSNTELGISLQPHPLTRFGALTLCIHRHWLSSRLPLTSPAAPRLPLRRPLPFSLWRRPPPLPPRRCKPEARRRPFHSGGGPSPSTLAAAPPLPPRRRKQEPRRRPLPLRLRPFPFHTGGAPSTPATVQVRPSPSSSIWMRSVLPRSR